MFNYIYMCRRLFEKSDSLQRVGLENHTFFLINLTFLDLLGDPGKSICSFRLIGILPFISQ